MSIEKKQAELMVKVEASTQLIQDCSEKTIRKILALQPLFPVKHQLTREEIVTNLHNPKNIAFFLEENGEVTGYVLAIPQDDAVEQYSDPLMRKDSGRYYIDQVAVIPQERRGLEFLHLGYALLEELGRREMNKVSSHLLTSNGLDKIIGKIFGPMSTERRIVSMPEFGDDLFEYMEVTYVK